MIKVVSALAVLISVFLSSFNLEISIKPQEPPQEVKKIIPPPPKPMNSKLVSKLELLDNIDKPFQEHIENVLLKNKYSCLGKSREAYASEITAALLRHCDGNLDLATWIASMAYVESSFRITADPKVSTARGLLQVIYHYHKWDLSKLGITREDLYTSPSQSIKAGIVVFKKYLKAEKGDYVKATRRYRGLSATEKQQRAYLNGIRRKRKELLNIIQQYA